MTKIRRSYREVRSEPVAPRTWQVLLDGKPVKTPAGQVLRLPTAALAEAVAQEWQIQHNDVRPTLMPLTRLANTAVDRVEPDRSQAVAEFINFVRHDLLCFRAPGPDALVARQSATWDPLLDWAKERCGISLKIVSGIAPVPLSHEALNNLESLILNFDDFALTGIVTAANILGSAVLAWAMAEGRISSAEAFAAAELDAIYQAEIWGEDAEIAVRNQKKSSELEITQKFIILAAAV